MHGVHRFILQLVLWLMFISHIYGQTVQSKMCSLAKTSVMNIITIGLLKKRFVCIVHSNETYFAYDLAPNSVDSTTGKVYLYAGQELTQAWAQLNQWFSKNDFRRSQLIAIQDASSDYLFIRKQGNTTEESLGILYNWDSNTIRTFAKIALSDDTVWISSPEDMSFFVVKGSDKLKLVKHKFDGKNLTEANQIVSLPEEYNICKSKTNSSEYKVSLKKSKCQKAVSRKDWNVKFGFSDAHRLYLFCQSNSIVILELSAMTSNLGSFTNINNVTLSNLFVCAAPPLAPVSNIIPQANSTSKKGAIILLAVVFSVILLLCCVALAFCWFCRPKPPNRLQQGLSPSNNTGKNTNPRLDQEEDSENGSSVGQAKQGKVNFVGGIPVPTKCIKMPKPKNKKTRNSKSSTRKVRGSTSKSRTKKNKATKSLRRNQSRNASQSSMKSRASRSRH